MEDNRLFIALQCEYDHQPGDCSGKIDLRSSMTQYDWQGDPESPDNPNRPFWCCDEHYKDYVAHWTDMWSNVPRG